MANTATLVPTQARGHSGNLMDVNSQVGARKRVVYPISPLFSITGTTTLPCGAGAPTFTVENSVSFVGAVIDADSDSVIIHIPVPDDMNVNETLHISWWYTFADTASSGITMTTLYATNVVKDYGDAASTTVTAPATTITIASHCR